jgi:hypothetical protein
MKRIPGFFLAALLIAGCNAKEKKSTSETADTTVNAPVHDPQPNPGADNTATTSIEWIDPVVNELGKLKQNQEIEITWRFKNTGSNNLVIQNVTAGCGCTIPEKPQQPFAPGEEGVIKAKFNGVGHGSISKQVTVMANTSPQNTHVLTFRGDIQ